ncbi:MAG: cytochrome c family protein [Alphaproteobacteria bacterium]|nr:cytochrome c family protein [Alphaproteobacteria bacterium]
MKFLAIIGVSLMIALGGGVASAANADKGAKVFKKCKACHSLKAGKKKVGPTLHGIFGSKAAKMKGFRYSKAMKKSGVTWDEATLDAFLIKPRKFMKGTKMGFAGLKKKKDRDNVIAYLMTIK